MRSVAGILLLLAAGLKAIQLAVEPTMIASSLGRWFFCAQVGVELSLGLLIVSGVWWRHVRWIAILLFGGFAAYSLTLAVNGAASCGCFGPIEINPWWTFALDAFVVIGLVLSIQNLIDDANRKTPKWASQQMLVAAILGVSGLCVAILVRQAENRSAAASDLVTTAGELAILEPETWVGKALPIANSIDIDLSQGSWVVLLHRHDCPDCTQAISQYETIASRLIGRRVAAIEVPPYGPRHVSMIEKVRGTRFHRGILSDCREWFVQTPVEIQLIDGIVTATSTELPTLKDSSEH